MPGCHTTCPVCFKDIEECECLTTKVCTKCGEEKMLREFKIDRKYNSGYASWCKKCNNKEQKKYKEKRYEANRKYAKTEKGKAALKRAYDNYQLRKAQKEYKERNPNKNSKVMQVR